MNSRVTITGANLIASYWSKKGSRTLKSINPIDGSRNEPEFVEATIEEIAEATKAAEMSLVDPAFQDIQLRSQFLGTIADQIESLGEEILEVCHLETGLPRQRLEGEKARTIFQLRSFSNLVRSGKFLEISVDKAIPEREPMPKPDIRKKNIPIGPVAVFSAGNFPLAFSTAGADTASALAAGCPVILKGHEGHLMTNEIIAQAILRAMEQTKMPNGVFSYVNGQYDIGKALVMDPRIKSVAFTGSYNGGKALMDYANKRLEPIPVFCEMGSINPVLISSKYQEAHWEELAPKIADSVFQGTGQFCTNPGLLMVQKGSLTRKFLTRIKELLESKEPTPMLNSRIFKNFSERVQKISGSGPEIENHSRGYIRIIDSGEFLKNLDFSEEVFGPYTLAVVFEKEGELLQLVSALKGQLTASLFFLEEEWKTMRPALILLEQKVGRMIYQSVPTGVEVCPSMHHGGPWPASSDPRFSSVGIDAIKRFLRPISYQGYPEIALPVELKESNPSNFSTRLDGKISN
jgi:2,5-dioxopentanoate dehydrogenase